MSPGLLNNPYKGTAIIEESQNLPLQLTFLPLNLSGHTTQKQPVPNT